MSNNIVSITDMDDLFDLPIFLSTLLVFFIGQAAHSYLANKQRTRLAVLHREKYFCQLVKDSDKMEEEIDQRLNALKEEHSDLLTQLEEFGIRGDIRPDDIPDEEELKRTLAGLENAQRQLEIHEKEICAIRQRIGLDDEISIEDLKQRTRRLEEEIKNLKDQTSKTQPTITGQDLDPELLDFIEKHDYPTDTLDKVLDVLSEIKANDRDEDLEEYLSQFERSKHNYPLELTELDVKRKKMELRLAHTKRLYQEELDSFNEAKVEYLFKITGAREILAQLKEKNEIVERIVDNRRREIERKKNDRSKDELSCAHDL